MAGVPTPKDRFTSLDIRAVAQELRALSRARMDKAFDRTSGGWVLSLRVPREGRRDLVLVPGRFAALLHESVPHSEELSPFARELRRLLEGALLESVPDPKGERLLEIGFRRSDDPEETLLALEMFGSGNLIVARGTTIAAAAQSRKWAHRTVGVGAPYARPPTRGDPWTAGVAEIESELARSRTDLASTFATRLALGGPIAEELIARGHWDGGAPAAGVAHRIAPALQAEIRQLAAEVGERPSGYLYFREGVAVDATPYESRRWADVAGVTEVVRPTFSEAAFQYFGSLQGPPVTPEEAAALEARRELERQVERQRAAVEGLTRAVEALQAQAEAIFRHYPEAEKALARPAPPEEESARIEVDLGGVRVPVYRNRSLRESVQALYEEAKRAQSKRAGAEAALRETERRLAEPTAPTTRLSPVAPSARPRTHWFEQYRWFLSSEGAVVVAGRDAASNDQVVKRHLKEGDIYVHADLHGAASVVVKHPPPGRPPLTDATLRQAGQWAVTFSKAWRAGLAAASAFWATYDQVSKAGASGEFVARGAWVVHGTKHFLSDLPLEVALGTIDYEGASLWMVAPPAAFAGRGRVRAILTPGRETDRAREEVALARELALPRSRLQSLLPAGGLSVRRV